MSGYTKEDARAMSDIFHQGEAAAVVSSLRYEFEKRGKEWLDAFEAFDNDLESDDAEIVLLGAVTPGMYVYNPRAGGDDVWQFVVRTMNQGGQWTLHLDDLGRAVYVNYHGQASPVVVRR